MNRFLFAAFATLICLWSLFPFVWAITTSLDTGGEISFGNYSSVFVDQPFARNLFNSIAVAFGTVLVSTLLALFASFPLARTSFTGRGLILSAFLCVSMFPQIAILSGLFELVRALGIFNRLSALVLSYLVFTLPFTIWTITVFMREIPKSLEESAMIDGAGPLLILFRILLPALAPSVVTTALLAFIAAWNEFLFALTLTLTDRARTVPVAIATMSGASEHEIPWGKIMAASVIVTLPVLAAVLAFQRRIVSGLTAGAVKG